MIKLSSRKTHINSNTDHQTNQRDNEGGGGVPRHPTFPGNAMLITVVKYCTISIANVYSYETLEENISEQKVSQNSWGLKGVVHTKLLKSLLVLQNFTIARKSGTMF